MTDGAAYREYAEACATFADRARSSRERAAWLLMSSAWLELALVREHALHRSADPIEPPPLLRSSDVDRSRQRRENAA